MNVIVAQRAATGILVGLVIELLEWHSQVGSGIDAASLIGADYCTDHVFPVG
ncbi:hypothetical protein D3C81_2303640 [compost metagenome]